MIAASPHTFHIPVMGLGFTIDTAVKVAQFGISSVMSISEDNLIEQMREHYCRKLGQPYVPVRNGEEDHRARRITAYLDLVSEIVNVQMRELSIQEFTGNNPIDKYFRLLDDNSPLKIIYNKMLNHTDPDIKKTYSELLKRNLKAGNIDVNIMTKCDNPAFTENGDPLPYEYSDAAAALRGFAKSKLRSSVIFSAGLNPRLFSYCESFEDFYPDKENVLRKTIIIKVSDFRSAEVQGKYLAKKGLWVSEFRIESGLNCGGHVFPTDGLLMGPILEEFNSKLGMLTEQMHELYLQALIRKEKTVPAQLPQTRLSVQGGIGNSCENTMLLKKYKVSSTGWGSPFLLVPEVTNIDQESLDLLSNAKPDDYYLSYASPLGIGFNNFRRSSSENQRKERIRKGRPGSPCYKKFLSFNTEFTKTPICTASRKYQYLKINQINQSDIAVAEKKKQIDEVMEKDCLCEGLSSSAFLVNNIEHSKKLKAVTLCPGPNLMFFSKVSTLEEMADHIYGRKNLLNNVPRPHMFIKELMLYADHYISRVKKNAVKKGESISAGANSFRDNLLKGIGYYVSLFPDLSEELKRIGERIMAA